MRTPQRTTPPWDIYLATFGIEIVLNRHLGDEAVFAALGKNLFDLGVRTQPRDVAFRLDEFGKVGIGVRPQREESYGS